MIYFHRICLVFLLQCVYLNLTFASKINIIEEKFIYSDEIPFFDNNGERHFLYEFENNTVLLVFWATWCGDCVKEMLNLDILQKDFRKLPFKIITISQDFYDKNIIEKYFFSYDIKHLTIYLDYKNQLFNSFEVVGLPTSFLINQNGDVVVSFIGNTAWHNQEVREILLSHIPGNYITPKNTYKLQSMIPVGNIKQNKDQEDNAQKESNRSFIE